MIEQDVDFRFEQYHYSTRKNRRTLLDSKLKAIII